MVCSATGAIAATQAAHTQHATHALAPPSPCSGHSRAEAEAEGAGAGVPRWRGGSPASTRLPTEKLGSPAASAASSCDSTCFWDLPGDALAAPASACVAGKVSYSLPPFPLSLSVIVLRVFGMSRLQLTSSEHMLAS